MVGIGRALQSAGHEVTFVTAEDFISQIADDGFSAMAAGEDMVSPALRAIAANPSFPGLSPLDKRAFILEHVFGAERLRTGFEEILAAARVVDPDVILHDPAEYAAPLVGEILVRPNVCVGYGLMLDPVLRDAVTAGALPWWEALSLSAPPAGGLYRHLYLDPCPPGLANPDIPGVPTSQPMRPLSMAPPTDYTLPPAVSGLPDRPLVYVTFGTLYTADLDPLRVVLDGLRRVAVNVVVTVGAQHRSGRRRSSRGHVAVESFIPQAALLPRCSLVVTHGGSGSILGPLEHGLPLVVLPRGADQFENAAAVERAGAGMVILPDDLTADRIASVANQALSDLQLHVGAARIAGQFAAMSHPDDCVACIEQLAHQPK